MANIGTKRALARGSSFLLCAALAWASSGCSKKEEQAQQQPAQPGTVNIGINPGTGAPIQAHEESGVMRYSDEGPEIGTLLTKHVTVVRKSADPGGEILTRLGPGTGVNRKARHGPYYLIDYPSGPGEMKPGWVLQDDLGSAAAPAHTATVAPTATTTTTPTVATVVPGGRPPPITVKKK